MHPLVVFLRVVLVMSEHVGRRHHLGGRRLASAQSKLLSMEEIPSSLFLALGFAVGHERRDSRPGQRGRSRVGSNCKITVTSTSWRKLALCEATPTALPVMNRQASGSASFVRVAALKSTWDVDVRSLMSKGENRLKAGRRLDWMEGSEVRSGRRGSWWSLSPFGLVLCLSCVHCDSLSVEVRFSPPLRISSGDSLSYHTEVECPLISQISLSCRLEI